MVCDSDDRARIELALSKRVSYEKLSKKFGISKDAIGRHRRNHMPPQLMAALQAYGKPTAVDLDELKKSESEGLLQTVAAQRARLWQALEVCEEIEDWNASARFHGQLTANLSLTAKILGEIETAFRVHKKHGTILGGVHLELTGDHVYHGARRRDTTLVGDLGGELHEVAAGTKV